MGWAVNNLTLVGGLDSILEGIGDICNAGGGVIGGRYGKNQTECM